MPLTQPFSLKPKSRQLALHPASLFASHSVQLDAAQQVLSF